MISTYPELAHPRCKQPFESEITKRSEGEEVQRRCPTVANFYNQNMGGVDRMVPIVQEYQLNYQGKKWWHALFFSALDIALINSWINWKESSQTLSLNEFKQKVIQQIGIPIHW
jgi:ABC-type proline/glycine betaine transport system permease subunit